MYHCNILYAIFKTQIIMFHTYPKILAFDKIDKKKNYYLQQNPGFKLAYKDENGTENMSSE